MGKRESGDIAKKILNVFAANPKNKLPIQDVAKKSEVSWESTKRHLETFTKLGILRETIQEGKSFYQEIGRTQLDTLFSIPLKNEDKKIIKQIYATIKELWSVSFNKPLNKTLVQKIAVEIVEKKFKNIPVAWYLYGQILLLPFEPDENYDDPFTDKSIIDLIKSVSETYAKLDGTAQVRRHQYEDKKNSLYLTKENLSYFINCCDLNDIKIKNKVRTCLNEFAFSWERKERNADIITILEDFCSTTLNILRNSDSKTLMLARSAIMGSFEAVWNLIGTYEFYDSLIEFYDKEFLYDILSGKLKVLRENALESLEELRDHEPKFELDNKYDKLKQLLGSTQRLTEKEKRIREEEIDKLKREKGEKVAQELLFKKFGI